MAKTKKKVKTCDNGGDHDEGPWSDLNHHLLYLVMMQLGVVDYLSFGGVCKSWRSLAVSNRNTFMRSKPPMKMHISYHGNKKACCLEDFEGRKFKTILPRFDGGAYVGLTCGYLIFFKKATREFWLVNPITRHQLCFPNFPILDPFHIYARYGMRGARGILVFSLSICQWVFLVIPVCSNKMLFSIAGKGAWHHLSCTSLFSGICAFKGMIYTLNKNVNNLSSCCLYELRLNSNPKLTLVDTKNSLIPSPFSQLVSSRDNVYVMHHVPLNGNIYMMGCSPEDRYRFQELDLGEMKWVSREKRIGECESFLSNFKHGVVEKRMWDQNRGQRLLQGHNKGDMLKLITIEKARSFSVKFWYFPHECLNVDLVD